MRWIYFFLVFVPVRSNFANFTTLENVISTPCADQNHYFLAPGVLTAGSINRACVSRFHPEGSARMLLTLAAEDKQTYTASRELPPGDGGCLDISVPLLPNTKADLTVNVWYKEAKCVWERRVSVRIASGRVVVVHTERARYRPGEVMRARVFAVKADLTPAPWNIEEIWLEGPPGAWEGTHVAEWLKVRSKLGLAQVQHEIDELAPPGMWTIKARLADGSQGSAVFWVGNYELPPFQLTVRHAPKVLRTSERLVWTVCVRYPWSEAVEGMLVIRLRSLGGNKPTSGVRTAARVRGRACHRHAAAAGRVGLLSADIVVADFSLQEEGTRIWQNTTVVSQVVDKPISLEFLTKPTTTISPALPYKLKVKATRWDDKPAANVRIIVCRSADDDKTCMSGDTDSTGVARIMFAAGDDANKGQYTFQAHLSNDTTTSTDPLTLSTRNSTIQAALGPLKADPHARTFVPLYLSLQNVTKPVTVHFVVITRGGVIYRWGATTQCPIASSATHIQTATRNTKCDDLMPQYDNDNTQNNINDNFDVNDKTRTNDNNSYDKNRISNNFGKTNKDGRSYDPKTNQYNDNRNQESNKVSDYIIRNMNEFDINSYLHKNAHDKNKVDKNATIFDRYSSVIVRNHADDKSNDINSVQYEANESDALLDRHLLRVMLPIKVTQQMCPDSHLIAYFYYNGEFVSASKHFEMDDCFINKVEINFQPRQTLPGSTATLQVSTPGPALCALTAIDVAAKWGSRGVRDVLMDGLRGMIDGHRNMTEFDTAVCTETPPALTSKQTTASWLSAAGVTTGDVVPRSCDSPALLVDDRTTPRTDFSEAWLWRFVAVGSDGAGSVSATAPDSITRYEANAVCLSKTGISISQPTVLQVFREFFIHADCPKRLRRGDSTILRYRIFNYLYEPLSVQVQIITSPHIQGPPNVVESICIPPRSPAARRVHLTASLPGGGSVGVRARAVTDGGCGNVTARRGVSDEVVMKIIVDPEGIPVQEHKSTLLCAKEEKSEVKWKWPESSAVAGSESLTVWLTGNLLGPLLADSDALVQLPRGCGEQNMARLATNLLALQHLEPHCSAALVARQHVARGFTRQLQYIHPAGGFSAFGAADLTPSTWLTAFSLRYMKKAHRILWPEQTIPPSLEKAEQWLRDQQMENGCFRNEGQVFHREMRGGLNEEGELASISLTAYVIISLLDSSLHSPSSYFSPLSSKLIRNTLSCLRALPPMKHKTPTRVYAHALRTYAFMRLNVYENELKSMNEAKYEDLLTEALKGGMLKANEGLLEVLELIKMARTDGDYMWWETSSLSTSIEATSYALLAITSNLNTAEWGGGAVRWLGTHRAHTGGFVNTQDTLVALEALSAWTSLQPSTANLTVTINSGTISKSVQISPKDRVPEIINLGSGDNLEVDVKGTGCALIQATRKYNSLAPGAPGAAGARGGLGVSVTVHSDGTFDCDNVTNSCYCAAVIEVCALWSGRFPSMALVEVSLPGGYCADARRLHSQLRIQDTVVRRIELPPSGTRATLYLGSAGAPLPARGHSCINVHAMGPRTSTRPAYVKIMDYYDPENNDTQFYTIPEDCPSRVTHEFTQDVTFNNIFNKARSLSDDEEVLITQEYTFEDIPDGIIPLEDPLFENLRLADKKEADNKTDMKNVNENSDKNTTELLENILSNVKEKSNLNTINNTNLKNNSNRNGDVVNVRQLINEINKNIYRDKVDGKLDFSSSISMNTDTEHRTKKILNIDKKEEMPEEELILKDRVATNLDATRSTHENIQESTNIVTMTTPYEIQQVNDKIQKQQDNDKVDNPNFTDFHIIDSEKDLEVPSGLEGPVPQIVLPPKDFNFQNYNSKESSQNIGINVPINTEMKSFVPSQTFEPGYFETHNIGVSQETQNFGTTQGIAQYLETSQRMTQDSRTLSGIPQNFGNSQGVIPLEPMPYIKAPENNKNLNRPVPNFGSNFERSHVQNRPTADFRRNFNPPQTFVTHNSREQNMNAQHFREYAIFDTTLRNDEANLRPIKNKPIEDLWIQ